MENTSKNLRWAFLGSMDYREAWDLQRSLAEATIHARKTSPLIHVLTTLTKIKKRVFGRAPGPA